jgi:hypothetical protein
VQRALWLIAAHSQLFNLVFEEEFFSLQFDDVKIVGGEIKLFGFNFFIECFVTALEFCKMAMHRHRAIPFEVADDHKSVPETERLRKLKNSASLVKSA